MKNYGVLKGRATAYTRDSDADPHSELEMDVNGTPFRIAVNVRSSRGPVQQRLIEYLLVDDLKHPVVDSARALPIGWNDLADGRDDGAALDYVRSNMFRAEEMRPLAHFITGPHNDLFELIEDLFQRAIDDHSAIVYAFGESWGPEKNKPDQYFGFEPGNGVHLIHMNQGDSENPNAKFHDGGLLIEFPAVGKTSAVFFKFQNQAWHTDESSGNPLSGAPAVPNVPIPEAGPVAPWPVIARDSPYRLARIVAAMVNPAGDDVGQEFVTVLNASGRTLSLDGWQILDSQDKADRLEGTLESGEARRVLLTGAGAQLSNKGGTITLLDDRGLKVDGVAYDTKAASPQGLPLVF